MTTQTRLHRLTLYTTELLRHWELSPSDWCVFIHTCSVVDTVGGIRITFTYGCPPPDFFSLLNVSLPYVYSDKDVAVGWRRWHLNYKRVHERVLEPRLDLLLYWEDDVHVFTQFHSETQFLKGKDLSRPSGGGAPRLTSSSTYSVSGLRRHLPYIYGESLVPVFRGTALKRAN